MATIVRSLEAARSGRSSELGKTLSSDEVKGKESLPSHLLLTSRLQQA